MNYEFSLNKTSLISLIAGWVFISVLLFGAGLIIGSQWLIGSATEPKETAQNDQPDVPKEPVLNEEAEAPRPKAATPKSIAPPKEPAATAPEKPAITAAEQTAKATATKLTADEVKIIQEAEPESASDGNAATEPDYVTVQVGVFLDQSEASRLLKEIERKGYAPTFFSGRDAEARQWFAVRIGAYSDKQQAANAAANFTRHEKMKAVVRPLGSL